MKGRSEGTACASQKRSYNEAQGVVTPALAGTGLSKKGGFGKPNPNKKCGCISV
jgi:hypothetical protein